MNCIIIEDEIPAQEILISYIKKIPELEMKGVFNSALKANKILKEEQVDILFLDINLPNISGINYLKTLQNPPFVVMTTAYSDYAAESFEFETIVDYLIKPFSFERFLKAINKIENKQSLPSQLVNLEAIEVTKNEDAVFINVDKTLHKIDLVKIIYVQSDRNYVTVVTENISLSFIDSLKKWNEYLTDDRFLQTHKSFIINLNYIEKITGNLVYINKQKIPVGRTFKDALFKKIKPIN